jgi:hypothetical protein
MSRFVGYLNRRPYLWLVDLATRSIEPAAELRDIPQGISEVIALDAAVAVRCGPTWFGLEPDLSGEGRPLTDAELSSAARRSASVDWPQEPSVYERGLVLPGRDGRTRTVTHPAIAYWRPFATWAPDRQSFAVAGSATPFVPPSGPIFSGTYEPEPSVLALVHVGDAAVQICEGTFEEFCYPPAWSVSGNLIVIGAPFEPRHLYTVRPEERILHRVEFKRHAPMPLLDADLLPTR